MLKGNSAAWGTEEFLGTRCWNPVELFIHLYLFTEYCGTKPFPVFIQLCFARILQTGVPVHWPKSFNLQIQFLQKGQSRAASICFISCFLSLFTASGTSQLDSSVCLCWCHCIRGYWGIPRKQSNFFLPLVWPIGFLKTWVWLSEL